MCALRLSSTQLISKKSGLTFTAVAFFSYLRLFISTEEENRIGGFFFSSLLPIGVHSLYPIHPNEVHTLRSLWATLVEDLILSGNDDDAALESGLSIHNQNIFETFTIVAISRDTVWTELSFLTLSATLYFYVHRERRKQAKLVHIVKNGREFTSFSR